MTSSQKRNGKMASASDLTNEDDAYNSIFGGDFGSLEIGSIISNKDTEGATQHLPDAIDFEDEDELAEEEDDDQNAGEETTDSDMNGEMDETKQDDQEDDEEIDMNAIPYDMLNGTSTQHHDDGVMIMGQEQDVLGSASIVNTNEYMTNDDNLLLNHSNRDLRMGSIDFQSGDNNALFNTNMDDKIFMEHNPSFDAGSFSLSNRTNKLRSSQEIINNEELKRIEQERVANEDKLLLKSYYPDFKRGKILKWNKFIYRKYGRYQWHRDATIMGEVLKPLFPSNLKFKVGRDTRKSFKSTSTESWNSEKKKGIVYATLEEIDPQSINKKIEDHHNTELPEGLLIATDDWDQENIINGDGNDGADNINKPLQITENNLQEVVDDWEWDEDNIVDAKLKEATAAQLDMNDEQLLLIKLENQKEEDKDHTTLSGEINEKAILKRLNISNDEAYSILKHTHQPKIRATISNLNIEHSQPALKLQSPYYKVQLPKPQLRYFHRPHFGSNIRSGTTITFNKLKLRKRKRDKGKEVKESFASTQDLTIGDTAPVYLMEYSEQTPLALSKFGMATKLINYYRKTSDQDTLRPKLPVGETHVLGVQDKSPFWNFGFVEPGHIVPTLYNNMVRAPVFKHDISGTDFLMVKSSGHGVSSRFYLKNINHLFTVGQTFPVEEIPGPNSRKVTSMRTTRLRMIVYRILNRTSSRAISIEPVNKHFPDQDYGQNRQKVKEFMKYQRDGPDKGLWKLKDGEQLLDNESTRKLITPEQVSEAESMSQGLQFHDDNEFFNFDEKLLKLEENLLPWNATKNFINATQMRAMIQIHGAGDPTGCGEGFSFLKTSMKGGFTKSGSHVNLDHQNNKKGQGGGHTYNVAQQQKIYDEEISKTWYTHAKSLSVTNPFEEIDDPDVVNPTNKHVKTHRDDNKVLKIVRKRRDANGIIQRQTIIIRDPRVIKGYLIGKERRKENKLDVDKLLEEETKIENPDDIELQKKLLQNELASLEKSQQRRAARQKKTVDGKVGKGKNTTRRCATCGQVGHIRTNKSCPMYNGGPLEDSTANASTATTPGPSTSVGPANNNETV
ncbi:hypothetical protein NCAS_0F02100 [Naumovozyma castellii]|uniref:Transcription initiation factor TFIID subunit 1 histone acetyltransferase domain-containing protein n=1 Tax=Naumovozyma castellii TaxID=27288 RepID=G0VGS3_NAUCA|nr:hypothetical protein NCAS_0F02100 [Naumovozyma castellii CBS 4309]CCC70694.1 hypothetical protein NCAS_0F02100 [Naumovozyma castellii CBS 4309]